MKKCFVVVLLFTGILFSGYRSYSQSRPEGISDDQFSRFEFAFENDFFNKTDYYYTNGLIFSYANPAFSKSPLFRIFSKPDKATYDQYGIMFEHKFYTPTNTSSEQVLIGDRPYSSYFLLSNFKETRDASKRSSTLLRIGVGLMGRYTGGKQVQSIVHAITPSTLPLGWQYQLRSDLLIDINYSYSGELVHSKFTDIRIVGSAQVGSLKDNLGIGSHMRIGWMNDYYTNKGDDLLAGKFQLFLDMNFNASFVIYNSLLQGGHVLDHALAYRITWDDVNRYLYSANLQMNFKYQTFGIALEQAFLSREFQLGLSHSYGGVIFTLDF